MANLIENRNVNSRFVELGESGESSGRNDLQGTRKDLRVSAEEIFCSIKTKFEALGVRISLGMSSIKTQRPFHELIQYQPPTKQDVHIELTNKTPEEYASEILDNPCRRKLYIDEIITYFQSKDFDAIAAPAVRGVIVGSIVAEELHKSFITIRKAEKGESTKFKVKCPYYYGDVMLTVPKNVKSGQRIGLTDDDLLKGGTLYASNRALELAGGRVVGIGVLIEWPQLKGRQRLEGFEVFSSLKVLGPAVEREKYGRV